MTKNIKALPKVIYIIGTGRSGSTILEILLSYSKNVFGAGELSNIIEDGFIENKICSCQEDFDECAIWGKVKKEQLALSNKQLEEWKNIQKKLDWHDGFLCQLTGLIKEDQSDLYNTYNTNLLKAIKNISGADIVIDSSKYAGRAYALSKIPNIDLKIICLTRSPAGLMSSFQKQNKEEQKPKSTLSSLIYYCYTTLTLRIIALFLRDKICFLQYESLLTETVECINKLEKFIDIKLSMTIKMIEEKKAFDVGHIVTGNRLRKNKKIYFYSKDIKEYHFTLPQKIAITIMRLWKWMLHL